MQKNPNILPYHVQYWLMREYHWRGSWGSRRGLGKRSCSYKRRYLKQKLNRNGRRQARYDLKKGFEVVRRAEISSYEWAY
jgi:hypothetical protein